MELLNFADERRIVKLTLLDVPDGWKVGVWDQFFAFRIFEFVVDPTSPDGTPQRNRMRIDSPEDPPAPPGEYSFTLLLTDAEEPSVVYERARFTVFVPEPGPVDTGTVSVRADFPVHVGPANSQYKFEVDVSNDTREERSFELAAEVRRGSPSGPIQQGWELNFVPAFGQRTLVSSVTVKANNDERLNVEVTPPFFAESGDYFIPMVVSRDELFGATLLQLTVVGRGELTMTTTTGQLNLDATAGDEATITARLGNIGSGDLIDIGLTADTPADWQISFDLARVETLPRDNIIDIPVHIKPPDDAVPGDYLITVRGRSEASRADIEIRVTVDQSTIWGWLGIVLVVLVLGGLGGLFWRLGRR